MYTFRNYKVILYVHLWITQQSICMTDTTAITQRDISYDTPMEVVRPFRDSITDQRRDILCDNADTAGGMVSMAELSLCPWMMRVEENRYRRPFRIAHAECAFDRPANVPGFVCRPVYRDMAVTILNRKVIERVAVACIILSTLLSVIIINETHIYALRTDFENRNTNNDEGRKVNIRILNQLRSYNNTEIDNPGGHSSKKRNVNIICSKSLQNKCLDTLFLDQTQHQSMAEYSICPWRLKVNENRYREPKKIMEAECICPGNVEIAGIVCRKVYREMEIKIFMNGYKLRSVQDISVACVPFLLK